MLILDKFEEFSLNKFGSNVVDCAVKFSDREFKRKLMNQMVEHSNNQ